MTLFAEALPFAIVQTSPKGIVQVLPDTEIVIKEDGIDQEEENMVQTISYEDIGGIGNQLQKVREMIELLSSILFYSEARDRPSARGSFAWPSRNWKDTDCQGRGVRDKGPLHIDKWSEISRSTTARVRSNSVRFLTRPQPTLQQSYSLTN